MTTNNIARSVFLIVLMTGILIAIGGFLGGSSGVLIAFAVAVGMNIFSYWNSDKIVLKMYNTQEVTAEENPRLYNIVARLAQRANLPMPKVYIYQNGTPNAFATGRNKNHAAVAVSTSLMDMLNDEELSGVIGHELAHIYGRDILIGTVVAMMAGAIMMIADMLKWSLIFGGNNSDEEESSNPLAMVVSIVMMFIAPIAAGIVQMAISRSREYVADERGAQFCGNPRALASALHKIAYGIEEHPMENAKPATAHMFIANPFSSEKIINLFATHPPIEDRINRLNNMQLNPASSGYVSTSSIIR